ncbi:HEPN domain-containing protein [Sphingomonas sp. PAMC 26605]|uniref:HEPN domain-containing protein n=1 Tax=Sphingomonas sp. PAMC 26605 TaxID=1112214 RepID=UPI0002FC848C|nr:HEPN domain-containing protein [Sphingomonas sp. PAMC 26605]
MGSKRAADVEFIRSECVRHQKRLNDRIRTDKADLFLDIPHPSGRGSLPVGRDAYDAFDRLAELATREGKLTGRVDIVTIRTPLIDAFVRIFLAGGEPVSEKAIGRMMRDAVRVANTGLKDQTFFLPCHLSTQPSDHDIEIGPVRFIGRRKGSAIFRKALLTYRRDEPEEYRQDRPFILTVMRYYRGFRWFAEVTVERADGNRSEALARQAVSSALDCLQLIIGARNSQRMRIGGLASHYERSAVLSLSPTGRPSYTSTTSYLGEVSLPDDWPTQLQDGEEADGCRRAGHAVAQILTAEAEHAIARRFLDAAQWFGEAVRDGSPSTRIIKFVTAIERLVLTGRFEDVADSVSDRVAALVTGLIEGQDFAQNKAAFKRVYGVRSELVHGSISPSSAKVKQSLRLAADFAEYSLLRALHNWPAISAQRAKGEAELHRWYEDLVSWVRDRAPGTGA